VNKRQTTFISFLLLIVIFFEVLLIKWHQFETTSIVSGKGIIYLLEPGEPINNLIQILKTKGSLKNEFYFKLLVKLHHAEHRLQAGEYFFPVGSTPLIIVTKLLRGEVVQHEFTIVNGWNIYQVLVALAANPYVKHTLTQESLKQIAHALGSTQSSPEGLLFPNTYFFTLNTPDVAILQRAYNVMTIYLNQEWLKRDQNLPYKTSYQALIVASMIEKETNIPTEMPIIASIIIKRLAIWMPLQIDSTIIYGLLPNFKGKLTTNDLHIKSPYNTYVNYGLPPTPIAMPGGNAIFAALHPARTDYLYFVARGEEGGHEFSKTLVEQNAAVQKYQIEPTQGAKQNNGSINQAKQTKK